MPRLRAARATLIVFVVIAAAAIAAANAAAAGTPTIELNTTPWNLYKTTALSGQLEDPTNPPLIVRASQEGASTSELTAEVISSSNEVVAPLAGITLEPEFSYWALSVDPGAVGLSEITVKVTGVESKTATATFTYGASPAFGVPALTRSHQDSAELTAAVPVFREEERTMMAVSSGDNTLRFYDRDESRPAIYNGHTTELCEFEVHGEPPLSKTEPFDFQSAFHVGSALYLAGPIGAGEGPGPENSEVLMQWVVGGSMPTPKGFCNRFTRLKPGLVAWDEAHGNAFGFASSGFTVGGFAPWGTGGNQPLLGFESPTPSGEALIVQETTSLPSVLAGTAPTYGEPILLDLEGLAIRELRTTAQSEILILAGESGGGETSPARLFLWDGKAGDQPRPVRVQEGGSTTATLPAAGGSWVGIVGDTPSGATGAQVQLLVAQGSTDLYGSGVPDREMPEGPLRKSASHVITLRPPGPPAQIEDLTATDPDGPGGPGTAELSWTPPDDGGSPITSYEITSPQLSSPIIIGGGAGSYLVEGLERGHSYGFQVAAINSEGEGLPSNYAEVTLLEITRSDPTSVDFGTQRQGTIGAPHTIVISSATEGLGNARVSIVGPDRDDFILIRNECFDISAFDSCEVVVRFAPSGSGTRSATLDVLSEYLSEPAVEVPLTGVGGPPVGEEAPTNFFVPTISGTKRVGGELICAPGGWTAVPAATFTYKWQREGTDISGATSSTYVPVKADKKTEVRCEVTGTNSAGSASAFSAAVTIKKAKKAAKATASRVMRAKRLGAAVRRARIERQLRARR
jgi:hypothetical protein